MKLILLAISILICSGSKNISAQGSYWGVQFSPGFSLQKWNNSSRDALLTLNGDLFVSSYGTNENNVFYAKTGYHQRGSQINFSNSILGNASSLKYLFHNVLIGVGAQKMLTENFGFPFYYLLGLRIEYTITTNFKDFDTSPSGSSYFANDIFVNKFNYGVDFGGGFVFNLNDKSDLFLEILISPDFSLQYEQEPLYGVHNPYTNQPENLPERLVRNLSFELAIGLRFKQ